MLPPERSRFFDSAREMSLLCFLMGLLFCVLHLLNGWALRVFEFSDHIALVYLPGFLRLANVLLLGLFWGTSATAMGGLMLMFWSNEGVLLGLCNLTMSATGALLSVVLMRVLQRRHVALSRLTDLIALAFLYALINALGHHLMWSWLDPSQLVRPEQLAYMVIGDVNGVILGGLLLRWLSRKTGLARKLRTRHDDH